MPDKKYIFSLPKRVVEKIDHENLSFDQLPKLVGILAMEVARLSAILEEQRCPKHIQEEFLDIEQAASLVRLEKSTIYGLTSQKKIPHRKNRGKLYFRADELLAWIEKND